MRAKAVTTWYAHGSPRKRCRISAAIIPHYPQQTERTACSRREARRCQHELEGAVATPSCGVRNGDDLVTRCALCSRRQRIRHILRNCTARQSQRLQRRLAALVAKPASMRPREIQRLAHRMSAVVVVEQTLYSSDRKLVHHALPA